MPKKSFLLVVLLLPTLVLGAVNVTEVRCYAEGENTYAVFYLDGEAPVRIVSYTGGVSLVVEGATVSGGRLAASVGLVEAGAFGSTATEAGFNLTLSSEAGEYRAWLATEPLRAVLEISPRRESIYVSTPILESPVIAEKPFEWKLGTVLVVDDDDGVNNGNPFGIDVDQRYTVVLDELGIPWETHIVGHNATGPSAGTLNDYPLVIYFTGLDTYKVCLGGNDRRALRQYLDGGGRLLLVSQNYLGRVSMNGSTSSGSLEEALGIASWKGDAKTKLALAEPASGLNAGLSLPLFGDRQIIGNWSDGFTVSSTGRELFRNRTTEDSCGVTVDGGGYRAAFLSFAWENIADPTEAKDLLRRLLAWLQA